MKYSIHFYEFFNNGLSSVFDLHHFPLFLPILALCSTGKFWNQSVICWNQRRNANHNLKLNLDSSTEYKTPPHSFLKHFDFDCRCWSLLHFSSAVMSYPHVSTCSLTADPYGLCQQVGPHCSPIYMFWWTKNESWYLWDDKNREWFFWNFFFV